MINIINVPGAARGRGRRCEATPRSCSQEFHSVLKLHRKGNGESIPPFLCPVHFLHISVWLLQYFHKKGEGDQEG
jgi:hypothetical protein